MLYMIEIITSRNMTATCNASTELQEFLYLMLTVLASSVPFVIKPDSQKCQVSDDITEDRAAVAAAADGCVLFLCHFVVVMVIVTEKKLISFDAVDDESELADIIADCAVNAVRRLSQPCMGDVAVAAPSTAPSATAK